MAGGEQLMTNISELLNANKFLSSDNAERLSAGLTNLEQLLDHLAESSKTYLSC